MENDYYLNLRYLMNPKNFNNLGHLCELSGCQLVDNIVDKKSQTVFAQ